MSFSSRGSSVCVQLDFLYYYYYFSSHSRFSFDASLVRVLFESTLLLLAVASVVPLTSFCSALVPCLPQRLYFVCFLCRFRCLRIDFLSFRGQVPSLFQRIYFVFRCRFLCLPIDFLLFRSLVPGLFQLLCFVFGRGFLCLPIDFLMFRVVVSGLLPPVLVCSA